MTNKTTDTNSSSSEDLLKDQVASEGAAPKAAPVADSKTKPTKKAKKVDKTKAELAEMKEIAQRVQADFENYKKRVAKERLEIQQRSTESLMNDLLTVIDAFEQALSALTDQPQPIIEGINKIKLQLGDVLAKHGFEEIVAEEVFNPDKHEAVLTEGDGTLDVPVIVEVLRKGYTVHGRVLRPAMVKVKS